MWHINKWNKSRKCNDYSLIALNFSGILSHADMTCSVCNVFVIVSYFLHLTNVSHCLPDSEIQIGPHKVMYRINTTDGTHVYVLIYGMHIILGKFFNPTNI